MLGGAHRILYTLKKKEQLCVQMPALMMAIQRH